MSSLKWDFIVTKKDDARHVIYFQVPENSPWFNGHFPEMPILPGVAILHHAWSLVAEFMGSDFYLKKLSRVKFRRIIKPGDNLVMSIDKIKNGNAGSLPFEVKKDNEPCCTGYFHIRKKP